MHDHPTQGRFKKMVPCITQITIGNCTLSLPSAAQCSLQGHYNGFKAHKLINIYILLQAFRAPTLPQCYFQFAMPLDKI